MADNPRAVKAIAVADEDDPFAHVPMPQYLPAVPASSGMPSSSSGALTHGATMTGTAESVGGGSHPHHQDWQQQYQSSQQLHDQQAGARSSPFYGEGGTTSASPGRQSYSQRHEVTYGDEMAERAIDYGASAFQPSEYQPHSPYRSTLALTHSDPTQYFTAPARGFAGPGSQPANHDDASGGWSADSYAGAAAAPANAVGAPPAATTAPFGAAAAVATSSPPPPPKQLSGMEQLLQAAAAMRQRRENARDALGLGGGGGHRSQAPTSSTTVGPSSSAAHDAATRTSATTPIAATAAKNFSASYAAGPTPTPPRAPTSGDVGATPTSHDGDQQQQQQHHRHHPSRGSNAPPSTPPPTSGVSPGFRSAAPTHATPAGVKVSGHDLGGEGGGADGNAAGPGDLFSMDAMSPTFCRVVQSPVDAQSQSPLPPPQAFQQQHAPQNPPQRGQQQHQNQNQNRNQQNRNQNRQPSGQFQSRSKQPTGVGESPFGPPDSKEDLSCGVASPFQPPPGVDPFKAPFPTPMEAKAASTTLQRRKAKITRFVPTGSSGPTTTNPTAASATAATAPAAPGQSALPAASEFAQGPTLPAAVPTGATGAAPPATVLTVYSTSGASPSSASTVAAQQVAAQQVEPAGLGLSVSPQRMPSVAASPQELPLQQHPQHQQQPEVPNVQARHEPSPAERLLRMMHDTTEQKAKDEKTQAKEARAAKRAAKKAQTTHGEGAFESQDNQPLNQTVAAATVAATGKRKGRPSAAAPAGNTSTSPARQSSKSTLHHQQQQQQQGSTHRQTSLEPFLPKKDQQRASKMFSVLIDDESDDNGGAISLSDNDENQATVPQPGQPQPGPGQFGGGLSTNRQGPTATRGSAATKGQPQSAVTGRSPVPSPVALMAQAVSNSKDGGAAGKTKASKSRKKKTDAAGGDQLDQGAAAAAAPKTKRKGKTTEAPLTPEQKTAAILSELSKVKGASFLSSVAECQSLYAAVEIAAQCFRSSLSVAEESSALSNEREGQVSLHAVATNASAVTGGVLSSCDDSSSSVFVDPPTSLPLSSNVFVSITAVSHDGDGFSLAARHPKTVGGPGGPAERLERCAGFCFTVHRPTRGEASVKASKVREVAAARAAALRAGTDPSTNDHRRQEEAEPRVPHQDVQVTVKKRARSNSFDLSDSDNEDSADVAALPQGHGPINPQSEGHRRKEEKMKQTAVLEGLQQWQISHSDPTFFVPLTVGLAAFKALLLETNVVFLSFNAGAFLVPLLGSGLLNDGPTSNHSETTTSDRAVHVRGGRGESSVNMQSSSSSSLSTSSFSYAVMSDLLATRLHDLRTMQWLLTPEDSVCAFHTACSLLPPSALPRAGSVFEICVPQVGKSPAQTPENISRSRTTVAAHAPATSKTTGLTFNATVNTMTVQSPDFAAAVCGDTSQSFASLAVALAALPFAFTTFMQMLSAFGLLRSYLTIERQAAVALTAMKVDGIGVDAGLAAEVSAEAERELRRIEATAKLVVAEIEAGETDGSLIAARLQHAHDASLSAAAQAEPATATKTKRTTGRGEYGVENDDPVSLLDRTQLPPFAARFNIQSPDDCRAVLYQMLQLDTALDAGAGGSGGGGGGGGSRASPHLGSAAGGGGGGGFGGPGPGVRETGKGKRSTAEDVLRQLSALHPMPSLILQYRKVAKLKQTYFDGVFALATDAEVPVDVQAAVDAIKGLPSSTRGPFSSSARTNSKGLQLLDMTGHASSGKRARDTDNSFGGVGISGRQPRIHSNFLQHGTDTGRLSSADPNMQNLPRGGSDGPAVTIHRRVQPDATNPSVVDVDSGKKLGTESVSFSNAVKKAITARPGFVLAALDYEQIELRLLAHLSGDVAMRNTLSAERKEDRDIHRMIASKVFRVQFHEVTGEQRSQAKRVVFGVLYGIGVRALAMQMWQSDKEHQPPPASTLATSSSSGELPKSSARSFDQCMEQARHLQFEFRKHFPQVDRYVREVHAQCRQSAQHNDGVHGHANATLLTVLEGLSPNQNQGDRRATDTASHALASRLTVLPGVTPGGGGGGGLSVTWTAGVGIVRTVQHRWRRLPDICSPDGGKKAQAERQAFNAVVQGSAADVVKKAMVDCVAFIAAQHHRERRDNKHHATPQHVTAQHGAASSSHHLVEDEQSPPMMWGSIRLVSQIHDELVFELPQHSAAATVPALRRAMEGAMQLAVPLVVKACVGPSLGDLTPWD